MSIGVPKELKDDCKTLLLDGLILEGLIREPVRADMQWPNSRRTAIRFLTDRGAIQEIETGHYRITAVGREYADELFAPQRYWFRRNWFAASVAGATIVAALVSTGANIANLVP